MNMISKRDLNEIQDMQIQRISVASVTNPWMTIFHLK